MEYKQFKFEPEDGFLNSEFYEDTPGNPREILQRQHNQTRDYINSLIATLNSNKEGESGSESIKSPVIRGVNGDNTFEQIKDIKRQLDQVTLDNVPDGSITECKLADESVTGEKIKNGSITLEKFSEDCRVPSSENSLALGGVAAEEYSPVCKAGDLNNFKVLVSGEKISSIQGKTVNNKRYFVNNNFIYCMDFYDDSISKLSDITLNSGMKFFVTESEEIFTVEYNDGKLRVFKYDVEYEELYPVNEFNLSLLNREYYFLVGADCDEENIFITIAISEDSRWKYTIYKFLKSDIEGDADLIREFDYEGPVGGMFFLADYDIVCGDVILRNKTDMEKIPFGNAICCDDGCLIMERGPIVAADSKTLMPMIACTNYQETNEVFVKNKYFYKLIDNYLFKTKLL